MNDEIEIDAAEIAWMIKGDEPLLIMKIRDEIYQFMDIRDIVEHFGKDRTARLMLYLVLTEDIDRELSINDLEEIWLKNPEVFEK